MTPQKLARVPRQPLWAVLLAAPLTLGVLACEDDTEPRPPQAAGQGGANSLPATPGGSTPSGGGGGEAPALPEVVGRVRALGQADFLLGAPFDGEGLVSGEGSEAGAWVEAAVVEGAFSLAGVRESDATWFVVEAEDDALYFPTLAQADGAAEPILLPLIERALVEAIFETVAVPTSPNPSAAQLAVRVVDGAGAPLAGVTLAVAGSGFVSYAEVGGWTEFAESTSDRGLAFVGNVLAEELPGQPVRLELSGPARREVSVLAAEGAVTLVTLVVTS